MDVVYPTLGDVLEIHRKELEAAGGSAGVCSESDIEAALDRMQQSFAGFEAYPTLSEKAAAFFRQVEGHHTSRIFLIFLDKSRGTTRSASP